MIKKNIKKRFSRECPTALISDSMEQAKREVVWAVTKEIALNTDHIFRLDTYTTTDPVLDEIVFEAQCRAEKVDEVSIFNCMDGEEFNPEVRLAMCFCKAVMGDDYKRWFKDALKKRRWQ